MILIKCDMGETEIKVIGNQAQNMAELSVGMNNFFRSLKKNMDESVFKAHVESFLVDIISGETFSMNEDEVEEIIKSAKAKHEKYKNNPMVVLLDSLRKAMHAIEEKEKAEDQKDAEE